ncbi:hypothetical protein PRZ48_010122 [Zasmidium cellare]|uniref:D-isomer specific 2-hydroxyacid dehydrogenase NAD-binding domain-containing protein n=1 Tax=Zasmidium cellare TaxID=395010 RepID=A0ABR0EE05_ZASCE|nr:hypothetical protein PRZ48_010122 [Zasmidium cellare]
MGGGPAKDLLLCALPWAEPKPIIAQLHKRFPKLEIEYIQTTTTRDFAELRQQVPKSLWNKATILCTIFTFPQNPSDAPDLELVHLTSAGSNQMQNQPLYKDTDVTITTSSGIHGPQIAEWVIMTGLVSSHKYKQLYELQKQAKWGKQGSEQTDFHKVRDQVGRRLGVLGYGSIGRQVGKVAKALGMEVVAYTATPKDTAEKKKDRGFIVPGTGDPDGEIPVEWYSGLDKESRLNFLKQDLDWLVVSVPLTEQTRHFLSTEEFDALSSGGKKPAFVTNIARGPIIDQPALIKALDEGVVLGAALDVTDPEPLPEDSPLWGMENVIVTPHISGVGESYTERTFKVLEENLVRREKGERLINVVNRKRGY